MLRLILIVAVSLTPLAAQAKPPEAVLEVFVNDRPFPVPIGDEPIVVLSGDDVYLDLSNSEGEPDRFFISIEDREPGKHPLVSVDPKTPFKRSRLKTHVGTYKLRGFVSSPDGFGEFKKVVQVVCKPPDEDNSPSPEPTPPNPTPTPKPDNKPTPPPQPPPVPAGEFNIAPKVAEIVRNISDPNKVATATGLATSADGIATQIAAGTITNAAVLLPMIGDAIRTTNSPVWQGVAPLFSQNLSAVYEANKAGKLALSATGEFRQPSAWAALVREIALGLRAGVK